MLYRLKCDKDVKVDVCDLGGSETVEIPVVLFEMLFELVPGESEYTRPWPPTEYDVSFDHPFEQAESGKGDVKDVCDE